MILVITERGETSAELGFLLHKHPRRVHRIDLKFGSGTVFYPEATDDVCTVALVVEIDPISLVRSKGARRGGWALGQYVNDRPYVASSFLSVAIGRVFRTAMNGTCAKHPEFVETARDLQVCLPAITVPDGTATLERLFSPLGYEVDASPLPLDPSFPSWGNSRCFSVKLRTKQPLHRVLKHLFIMIPTLDRVKHYWVGPEEIDKLLEKSRDWLADHPEKKWIVTRYLKFRRQYTNEAMERLDPTPEDSEKMDSPERVEKHTSLHSKRLDRVAEIISDLNPESVLDLGCGEGKLLMRLLERTRVPRITGMDIDSRSLEFAKERIEHADLPKKSRERLSLLHGSLTYRDERLAGFELATLIEVVEHFDPDRLRTLERVVFQCAAPARIIVTTPNREYNALFETLSESQLRHPDHRFEWTREEFADWCERIGFEHGYDFEIEPLGDPDPKHGSPSQMAVFCRAELAGEREKSE